MRRARVAFLALAALAAAFLADVMRPRATAAGFFRLITLGSITRKEKLKISIDRLSIVR